MEHLQKTVSEMQPVSSLLSTALRKQRKRKKSQQARSLNIVNVTAPAACKKILVETVSHVKKAKATVRRCSVQ